MSDIYFILGWIFFGLVSAGIWIGMCRYMADSFSDITLGEYLIGLITFAFGPIWLGVMLIIFISLWLHERIPPIPAKFNFYKKIIKRINEPIIRKK